MVITYGFESCPYCQKLHRYLDSRGVAYEVRDIELDETAAKECQEISGDLSVPVTTIDGVNYVLGFDKKKIDALLEEATA